MTSKMIEREQYHEMIQAESEEEEELEVFETAPEVEDDEPSRMGWNKVTVRPTWPPPQREDAQLWTHSLVRAIRCFYFIPLPFPQGYGDGS
jgi:hypothetical protein